MTGAASSLARTKSSVPCTASCGTIRKWSASSSSSSSSGNIDANRRDSGGGDQKRYQERSPQRLPPDRESPNLRPTSHEPRHHPCVRDLQTPLDPPTAKESDRAGTRATP